MKRSLLVILVLIAYQFSHAQMTSRVIADNLFIPWEMVYAPDNHIWFTQKNGYICRVDPATQVVDTLYYESNTVIQNEGGMLGMALHPNFPTDPYVYVAYNYNSGSYKERIVRYTYSGGTLGSPQTIIDNINASNIHNGCRLVIVGNHLYITTGDAATASIAQDINEINGKTLRINLDGTIPSDNPISGSPLWTWGNRNAQGLVYANGKLYSSEHGPNSDDELNILEKGRNYGWPAVRGMCNLLAEIDFCNDSNVVEPIIAWTPTLAVSGIDYYDHPMFPDLKGSVLMTTLKDRKLYQIKLNSTFDQVADTNIISLVSGDRMRAICIDPDGRIYISTSNSLASGTGSKVDKIIEIYDPNYSQIANLLKEQGTAIAVYPNPVSDQLNIYANINSTSLKYTIYNMSGQVMSSGNLNAGYNNISVSALPGGMYNILVDDKDERIHFSKFNKQ